VLPLLAAVALGCGAPAPKGTLSNGGTWRRGEERFHVETLPPPWRRITSPAGDVAFHHPGVNAVIAANAACRGHKDPPLQVLLNDLLIGTTGREYLLEERVPIDGREGLHAVVRLELDGVPLIFDVYVVKKDGCVYDLALVTSPSAYEATADTFVGFVSRFEAMGDAYR
jgi:hypothetical protein